MIRFLTIFFLLILTACGDKLPKDINEAIAYFEKNWSGKTKEEFKNKTEKKAVLDAHFAVGMWIRNEWIHGKRDTLLTNQFNSLGIYHPDDMSSIILTSLHRKLNDKPLDIEGQVQHYKDYWQPIRDCNKKAEKDALNAYKSFNIGDSIEIQMYVDNDDNQRNAVSFSCPTKNDWEFNSKKDLLLKGVVTEKYFINSKTNVFFKVKVSYLNIPDTKIYMQEVKLGDIHNFHLENLRVKHYH